MSEESNDNGIMSSIMSAQESSTKNFPKPNPATVMVWFFVVSIVYIFLQIYNIYNLSSVDSINTNRENPIYMLIYAGLLLFGTYFININISKTLCSTQNVQWGQVFFLTVLP